jgi:hypothetical protein
MAVLAVVIMDIKCGIEIDNGAGMTLTALSIGTDPGMIPSGMRIKVCGIVFTRAAVMAGITCVDSIIFGDTVIHSTADERVVTSIRVEMTQRTWVTGAITVNNIYHLGLVVLACLIMATGTLCITRHPERRYMIRVI